MASILFLAPADLGEAVLATGALAHVLREGDEVTVVCDPDAAPLFRAVPGLAEIHVIRPEAKIRSWLELIYGGVRGHDGAWDHGIDARGGWIEQFLGLRLRRDSNPSRSIRHHVDEWTDSFGAERPLAPKIWIDEQARAAALAVRSSSGPSLVLAPGGASFNKRWSSERFAAVARRLATGPLGGAEVLVVGAAARDTEVTAAIVASLDADGVLARDCGEAVDLLAAAALLESATLCIGNDNALAHIAAAVGAPTLTLFGPTDERVRAPYGPRARALRGKALEDLLAGGGRENVMDDISVDAVEAAALELLHAGGLR